MRTFLVGISLTLATACGQLHDLGEDNVAEDLRRKDAGAADAGSKDAGPKGDAGAKDTDAGTASMDAAIGDAAIGDAESGKGAEAGTPDASTTPDAGGSGVVCQGPLMTTAQAMSYLDVANGVLLKAIGRFTITKRERRCYAGAACSAWGPSSNAVTAPFFYNSDTFSSDFSASDPMFVFLTGEVFVKYELNAPYLELVGDTQNGVWNFGSSADYLDNHLAFNGLINPTSASNSIAAVVAYVYQQSTSSSAVATFAGSPLTLTGSVAATCTQFATSRTQTLKDSASNEYTLETELALNATFGTSCAGPAARCGNLNCGTIADGCGGTLDCGQCSGQDSCGGGGTPNMCGNMLPCGGSCGPNQVCCPGKGCWDACN